MKVTHIIGEVGRFWVESETNHEQQHLVDLMEDACGCPSFTCRNRKYREQFGHNFRCKHIRRAREVFTDEIIDSLKTHALSK